MVFKGVFMSAMQVGLIATVPWAIMNGSVGWWGVALLMYLLYGFVGVVVTYHRLLTHRTFQTGKGFRYFATFFAAMGSLLSPLEWAQQHTAHHRYSDVKGDPHSPKLLGWKAWFFCFHGESKGTVFVFRLAKEPFMRFMHVHYYPILGTYLILLYLLGGIHLLIFGWALPCLATLWCQAMAVMQHDDEGATNGGWISRIMTFNETWHKYHHENPGDITRDGAPYWLIRLIRTDKRGRR